MQTTEHSSKNLHILEKLAAAQLEILNCHAIALKFAEEHPSAYGEAMALSVQSARRIVDRLRGELLAAKIGLDLNQFRALGLSGKN